MDSVGSAVQWWLPGAASPSAGEALRSSACFTCCVLHAAQPDTDIGPCAASCGIYAHICPAQLCCCSSLPCPAPACLRFLPCFPWPTRACWCLRVLALPGFPLLASPCFALLACEPGVVAFGCCMLGVAAGMHPFLTLLGAATCYLCLISCAAVMHG